MNTFQWSDIFNTGLPTVDEQHHRLVDLINRFGSLAMSPEVTSGDDLERVFAELADYAVYHFAEEEALMKTTGLDARHFEQHQHDHKNFLDEVTHLHSEVSTSNLAAAKALLQFLTQWLAYHILGSDQFMAKQIASIMSGRGPAEAYLADVPDHDPATGMLLSALNRLFQQVSQRNRDLLELNRTLETRVAERTQSLQEANQRLEDLANTDILTGLPNRRYALWRFAVEWEASVRDGTQLSCMMIDADGFKAINDMHGHDAGDVVLRALSAELRHAVRTDDIVCRLGGDEFLIICARTAQAGALALAEVIRKQVSLLRVPAGAGVWQGSVSVGVAERTPAMTGLDGLIEAADRGVYIAKRRGRNCVASGDGAVPDPGQ